MVNGERRKAVFIHYLLFTVDHLLSLTSRLAHPYDALFD